MSPSFFNRYDYIYITRSKFLTATCDTSLSLPFAAIPSSFSFPPAPFNPIRFSSSPCSEGLNALGSNHVPSRKSIKSFKAVSGVYVGTSVVLCGW